MGLKDNAKALIDANVYANGQEQITGQGLNATLKGMVDILPTTDEILTGINGTATESNSPNTAAGFFRYIVTEPITTGSAWGIEVTQAELDDNWVFFNVTDGVITKDSKPQQGGKSAYQLAVEAGYGGTEIEWLESLNGEDGADGTDGKATELWTPKAFAANSAVTHQNKLWINTAPTVAGDVPGVSPLWIPRVDTGMKMTNLVPNGDFSNGTTGWFAYQSVNSVTDGVLTNTGTGTGGSGTENSMSVVIGERIIGHKYYFRTNVVSKNTACQRIRIMTPTHAQIDNPVMNTPYLLSGVYTASNTNNVLGINHSYSSFAETVGNAIEVDNVMYINLTQSFGAGKEPTKEEMDAFIDFVGYWEADTLSRNQIYQWQNNVIKNNKAEVAQLRTDLGVKIKNIAPNGDASNGLTGWSVGGASNALVGGVVVNTGTAGNEPLAVVASEPVVIGNKYYAKVNVTPKSALVTALRLRSNQDFNQIDNPPINVTQTLSGIITATATSGGIAIYHRYATASDALGKSIEIDNLVYINLTAAFGAGKEPTKAQMDILTTIAPYWEGDTLNRNQILRWQRELIQTVDISGKADHGYTGGETIKTLKQVEAIAVASAGQATTIFEASGDLAAGVDTVIPYNKFSPVLTKRPANIQVVHNDEVKNVTAKYLSNGDNFDVRLNSTSALTGAEISVIGSKIDTAKADVGDILVWNNATNQKQFVKVVDYSAAESGLIPLGVVFHREEGKAYILPKDDQAQEVPWASAFKATLQGFDFATGGTFTVTVNGVTTTAISYTNADTLTTVADKINTAMNVGAAGTALKNWTVTVANGVVVLVRLFYGPKLNTVTVTDASSKVTRTILNADNLSEPSPLITSYPNMLRNDGYAGGGDAGLNFERFRSYLYQFGDATSVNQPVGSGDPIVSFARFTATYHPALVAYYGTGEDGYTRYMQDKMVKYPFPNNVAGFKTGKMDSDILGAVVFTDVDGSTKPSFPAAYVAKTYGVTVAGQTTGLEAGAWWLPSIYEMYFMFNQRKTDGTDSVNVALTKIGGTKLNNANIGFWSVNQWVAGTAWQNYGSSGRYAALNKMTAKNGTIPMHVRAITAIQL